MIDPAAAAKLAAAILLAFAVQVTSSVPPKSCDKTRTILNGTRGFIMDGIATINYTQNTHCEWLIKAEPEQFISLTFLHMDTECGYDYVFVYDGTSMNDMLIGSFSGKVLPPTVIANSGM